MKNYFMNFNKNTKVEIPTISFKAEDNSEARAKVEVTARYYDYVQGITLTGISLYVGGIGTGWYPVSLEPDMPAKQPSDKPSYPADSGLVGFSSKQKPDSVVTSEACDSLIQEFSERERLND